MGAMNWGRSTKGRPKGLGGFSSAKTSWSSWDIWDFDQVGHWMPRYHHHINGPIKKSPGLNYRASDGQSWIGFAPHVASAEIHYLNGAQHHPLSVTVGLHIQIFLKARNLLFLKQKEPKAIFAKIVLIKWCWAKRVQQLLCSGANLFKGINANLYFRFCDTFTA